MFSAALIGLGGIAWKYDDARPSTHPLTQAGAFLHHSDVHLEGGCAPDAYDRNAFTKWCQRPSWESPEEMFEHCSPDIVGICSPTATHFEHAIFCMKKGVKALWLEKPPAQSSDEITLLIAEAAKTQTLVCVNYFRRYLPVYQRVKQLMHEWGPCHHIQITYSPGLERNGCHLLDMAFYLTEAKSFMLESSVPCPDWENPTFIAKLSQGTMLSGAGAFASYHSNDMHIMCEGGILSVLSGGESLVMAPKIPNPRFPGFFTIGRQPPLSCSHELENYMFPVLKNMVESLHGNGTPTSSLQTANQSQKLLEYILKETVK